MKKQVLLLSAFLSSCADDGKICPKVNVDYPQYLEISECWSAKNGKFEGFLILLEGKNHFVPFFVSKRCRFNLFNIPKKELFSVISYTSPILVKEIIYKEFKGKIGSNFLSHPPNIKENNKVYYIRSNFYISTQENNSYLTLYNIEEFSDTKSTVKEFFLQRDGCGGL